MDGRVYKKDGDGPDHGSSERISLFNFWYLPYLPELLFFEFVDFSGNESSN